MAWIAQRRKLIVALVGIAVGVVTQAGFASNQWVALGIALATALGVYVAPNAPTPVAAKKPRAAKPAL